MLTWEHVVSRKGRCLPPSHSSQMQGQIVTQVLRQRIGERIGSLKISWRQASIDAGLGSGFIQDLITGRAKDPPEEAIAKLAAALKCSPAYLLGQPEEEASEPRLPVPDAVQRPYAAQRPDAVMTLKIVEELLTGGHIDAARLAVRRALKEIQSEEMDGPLSDRG